MKLTDELKIALVTAICILGLSVVSKYVINVELDFIAQYGPVWMFIVYVITKERQKKSNICCTALFWSLTIILVTVAILVIYAI